MATDFAKHYLPSATQAKTSWVGCQGFFSMSDNKNTGKAAAAAAAGNKKAKATTSKAVATKSKKDLQVAPAKKAEVVKTDKKNAKAGNPFDGVLWLLALALIVAAIGGNYYYTQFMMVDESSFARLGRVAIVIVTILVGLALTLLTSTGKKLVSFGRSSYTELRKVVWPSRNEAMQTTLIVFVTVCIVSVFLYLCDLVFLQIVRVITI